MPVTTTYPQTSSIVQFVTKQCGWIPVEVKVIGNVLGVRFPAADQATFAERDGVRTLTAALERLYGNRFERVHIRFQDAAFGSTFGV